MTPEKARRSRQTGTQAEASVEEFFHRSGYSTLARNYHSREGELDLVVRKDDLVVFVEVKARKERSLVDPVSSVTPSKQRKIVRAALHFLEKHQLDDVAFRFDVVAVTLSSAAAAPVIEHLESAFDASVADEPASRFS